MPISPIVPTINEITVVTMIIAGIAAKANFTRNRTSAQNGIVIPATSTEVEREVVGRGEVCNVFGEVTIALTPMAKKAAAIADSMDAAGAAKCPEERLP